MRTDDPELRAIQTIERTLRALPATTQERVLAYVLARRKPVEGTWSAVPAQALTLAPVSLPASEPPVVLGGPAIMCAHPSLHGKTAGPGKKLVCSECAATVG